MNYEGSESREKTPEKFGATIINSGDGIAKSESSNPMVFAHETGNETVEVSVNPNYLWSEIIAGDYLYGVFDGAKNANAGKYQTLKPAIVRWNKSTNRGEVIERGEVRWIE